MLSILGLIPQPPGKVEEGEAIYKGKDLLKLKKEQLRQIRGPEIAMIFQDTMTSLNPVYSIGFQLKESLKTHQQITEKQALERSVELLDLVGVPSARQRLSNYPHQFSGGMRQRVMIAMALSCNPSLLIADEPTTALDVTIQAQILRLVMQLKQDLGMAVIWITHDLGVAAKLAERIIVMYAGYIVEDSPVLEYYKTPKHPYSIGLLGSLPRINEAPGTKLSSIPGQPPDLTTDFRGCPFYVRCSYRVEKCFHTMPTLDHVNEKRRVACWCKDKT
jgi:oligopeptide transport system ATP-binding protein